MSKFVDKLARLSRAGGPAMGFRHSPATQSPSMLLVVEIPGSDVSSTKDVVAVGVDALVVSIDSLKEHTTGLKGVAKMAGDTAWGVHISKLAAQDVAALRDLGCDFLIIDALATPAAILFEKDLGKILRVNAQWGDGLLRALDQVALDALLLDTDDGDAPGLSLHRLLQWQRLASLGHKPLLMGVSQALAKADLQTLHSIGVEGILHKHEAGTSIEPLQQARRAIDALPAYRGRSRAMALLPRIETASLAEEEDEEEEE